MADIVRQQGSAIPQTMQSRYRDMGDGTHALVVAADGDANIQVGDVDVSDVNPVPVVVRILPQWEYLGGETLNPAAASIAATLPANTTIVELRPEEEEITFLINGAPATANSPGYIVAGGAEIIGPLSNLNSLAILQAVGGLTHIQYFREVSA